MVSKRKEAGRRARESGSHKERWQEVPDKREAARLSGQSSLMEAPRGTQSPSSPPPIPTSGLFCFGDNSEGNLGSGQDAKPKGEDNVAAAVNTPLPLELSLPVRFVAVAAGLYHSLALTAEGKVFSWGRSENGRLGLGSSTAEHVRRPTLIESLSNTSIAHIAAGYHHSMALSTKSQLYSWGSGWSGQLGTGMNADANTPTLVEVPTKQDKSGKLIRLSAGYHHSLAVTDTGRLYAWGTGDAGQLGLGLQKKRTNFPILIASVAHARFVAISASEHHSVALTEEGHVYSWGHNRWKQLGHDASTPDTTSVPNQVNTTMTFTRIAAGSAHTLAISKEHQLYYWGRMVLSSELYDTPRLLEATKESTFADVASRVNHCLAVTKTGDLWSFGYNEFGQCGVGHCNPVLAPTLCTAINGLKFSSIVAGGNHSLALAQHESLQGSGYVWTSSPSSSSEDLKKNNLIRLDLSAEPKRSSLVLSSGSNGNSGTNGNSSPSPSTSPDQPTTAANTSPRRRISITKPASANIYDQLTALTKREQDLRAEREALRAQQKALDEAMAEWHRKDDELSAERNRILKEAGLA